MKIDLHRKHCRRAPCPVHMLSSTHPPHLESNTCWGSLHISPAKEDPPQIWSGLPWFSNEAEKRQPQDPLLSLTPSWSPHSEGKTAWFTHQPGPIPAACRSMSPRKARQDDVENILKFNAVKLHFGHELPSVKHFLTHTPIPFKILICKWHRTVLVILCAL